MWVKINWRRRLKNDAEKSVKCCRFDQRVWTIGRERIKKDAFFHTKTVWKRIGVDTGVKTKRKANRRKFTTVQTNLTYLCFSCLLSAWVHWDAYNRTNTYNLYNRERNHFTITTEIHARSLANFYCPYADVHINLKFMWRVSEREQAIRQFVIVKKKNWRQFLMRLSCYWQWISS